MGENSRALFTSVVERAATIVWNGPAGVFEFEKFASGSKTLLEAIVLATEKGTTSIIGEQFANIEALISLISRFFSN